jgi:hypothetical protein
VLTRVSPFDARSIERKAAEALPDWVYRYVSAAAGDGRTQQANIDAYSHFGIIPRMMVSPPQRDLSIDLFGKRLTSPIFMCPIGLIGLCSPDFQGDVAAARASADTGVPFTLWTFSRAPMEEVIKHAGSTPNFSASGPPIWSAETSRNSVAFAWRTTIPTTVSPSTSPNRPARTRPPLSRSVGIGRPYDLTLAICGFKDVAALKQAGCERVFTSR